MASHPLFHLLPFLLVLLAGLHPEGTSASPAAPPNHINEAHTDLSKRQYNAARYCDNSRTQGMCYLEYSRPGTTTVPVLRVAVPEGVSSGSTFDTVLQIVAPVTLGWAGFAWGGGMTRNPLTVVWPNGEGVTVSSRWSEGRTLPPVYPSATYRTISASRNGTHWTAEVVCSGCSRWNGGSLNINGVHTFAWAVSRTPVSQPGNPASSFAYHNNVGMFSEPMSMAAVPRAVFDEHVRGAR
ncbi:hypothetical protein VTJ49DRAFT_2059 [Mycothermus thermophilus]|uniref:Cellobiose dehydrogenase-like cytochrome domain-containing protein n=1 Tax=Humicola insolens TaxID=85995 RepID=A0ABR3VAS0_HUMIN